MDYRENCTGENNLSIQLGYLAEFLLELAVNMFLKAEEQTENNMSANAITLCRTSLATDIFDNNRTGRTSSYKEKKNQKQETQRGRVRKK